MAQSDEEDDYMNMTFEDVTNTPKETSLQRRVRKQREGEERGRIKSKAELKDEEEAAREAALSKALDTSSKGFKMMAKFGFKQGDTLGKSEDARKEPIRVSVKEDRGGIGHASDKKRKFKEQMEAAAKRAKVQEETQDEYLERIRQEHKEKELTGQLRSAQKVAERLDEEADEHGRENEASANVGDPGEKDRNTVPNTRPLKSMNVLYREIVRNRAEKERDRIVRKGLTSSLPRLSAVGEEEDVAYDPTTSADIARTLAENELDEEDRELEEFNALPIAERLEKLVLYLREKYHYCFWCKYRYPDAELDGCPGVTEEDHD
ncbi:G-patch-domain-containing protein [Delitschia confertaspora ATCC 74209]|uniref:G-patch-domain-containing protein n=1 Tax=Delitschia confertaspora ATCC 74209 TaxID=1513339 RepID=A0A9P4JLS3_9PLEO|nr:G-patch-domain-containing protein [Delitschia confertaspora ATCC 74209]